MQQLVELLANTFDAVRYLVDSALFSGFEDVHDSVTSVTECLDDFAPGVLHRIHHISLLSEAV